MSAKQARAAKARKRALGPWGYVVCVGDSTGTNAFCEVVSLFPPVVRFPPVTGVSDGLRVVKA